MNMHASQQGQDGSQIYKDLERWRAWVPLTSIDNIWQWVKTRIHWLTVVDLVGRSS